VSLAGQLGDVCLICVCRRALPLHLLLTAFGFFIRAILLRSLFVVYGIGEAAPLGGGFGRWCSLKSFVS